MRVTLEIEESTLSEILEATSEKKKSPALAKALNEFLRTRKRQAFLRKVMNGETDYKASNEEIEAITSLER